MFILKLMFNFQKLNEDSYNEKVDFIKLDNDDRSIKIRIIKS